MAGEAVELFYSYAHEDEALRDQLNDHLALLQHQGFIKGWYDRNISAGGLWAEEIDKHLETAQIILLLVSRAFIASKYCYGIEMQKAIARHEAGEATVIPIVLRPCDWEAAPFGKLQALPKNAKPVTSWSNRDAAFTDIAKGIRKIIQRTDDHSSPTVLPVDYAKRKSTRRRGEVAEMNMPTVPTTPVLPADPSSLSRAVLKKAIDRYHRELKEYEGLADHELALRSAFQNLLAYTARHIGLTLVPEQTIEDGIRPDGVLRDASNLRRGYWEAKGPNSNLEREIVEKLKKNYPTTNTIFENTKRAVLYQGKRRVFECSLQKADDVGDLLELFLSYTEPHIEKFQTAVLEFKKRLPALVSDLLGIIEKERKQNRKFIAAFESFATICRASLNPNLNDSAIDEMLVQHLLTERLFRTVFNNPDFVNRNVIAAEIEKVIIALTSRSFNRQEFLKSLDRYYVAIEGTAKGIESWAERQEFLNNVYEGFFQGFSVKQADIYGVVYTPQEIVDFMCNSVEEVLKNEFGTSLSELGVQILDPATGTGSFIVNLVHRVPSYRLKDKYRNDLFCNEIMLLPYYIASLNIEHEYYERMGEYQSFEGVCFADTLELAEGKQLALFVEENTERVQREKDAQIMVVLGNPPYNVGQVNENDNNKNRKYPIIDQRIRETYAKDSKASNKNALSDAYVKFFRWASDRLGERDGIVCLVTNNSFIDQIAFDGMRMHLQKDFTRIYHLDLHGNVRKNPKLSGTTHNVFGIQVGVGITIAVRNSQNPYHAIYYYRVPETWRREEKLAFLREKGTASKVDWQELQPDEKYTWLTEGMRPEFTTFLPMGTKAAKLEEIQQAQTLFKTYSPGVSTARDIWVHASTASELSAKVKRIIETYNGEVDRWRRRGGDKTSVDSFVTYDDTKIKWSEGLKFNLQRGTYAMLNEEKVRQSLYRPFCKQWFFFDRILAERVYLMPLFFPNKESERENKVLCLTNLGSEKPFMVLVADSIPNYHLVGAGAISLCFPYYTYNEDGTNRRENITDWALKQFQDKYGARVTRWDIFHYVYGMLHHPQYRERYAENLKRDLPHIPLLNRQDAFLACVSIGKQLMDIHLNYEQAKEYKLEWFENEGVPFSWRVEKMRLSTDRRVVVVNESLRVGPLPPECFEYRLGNRSALEWVIDQYQVSKDKRSGIESDPNRLDDEEYIVRLVGRVVTASVETVRLVSELAQAVTIEDWMEEMVNGSATRSIDLDLSEDQDKD